MTHSIVHDRLRGNRIVRGIARSLGLGYNVVSGFGEAANSMNEARPGDLVLFVARDYKRFIVQLEPGE